MALPKALVEWLVDTGFNSCYEARKKPIVQITVWQCRFLNSDIYTECCPVHRIANLQK